MGSEEHERLEALLTELQATAEKAASVPVLHTDVVTKGVLKRWRDRKAKDKAQLESINAKLRGYAWILQAVAIGRDGPVFAEVPAGWPQFPHDQRLLRDLIALSRQGLLNRLRRCVGCDLWFFASKPNQTHHSAGCYQHTWRSTDKFKRRNQKYQRDYYRNVLSPVTAKHLKSKRGEKKRHAKKR